LCRIIQSVEKELKQESKSAETLAKKKEAAVAKVQDIQGRMSALDFSEAEFNSLETERVELESTVSDLRDKLETLSAQLEGRLAFNYSDPVRGFDRSKVKGLVARLVEVKRSEHATALEVVAGAKLYQVVVDEAITGKALLNRGNLKRRVTIIPLDKIQARRVSSSACEKASQVAEELGSTASPAIELVGFDEEVRNAMEYVFGSTLVVDGMKAANQICDATKTRTVTLDGDVYDPSGTISGGSRNSLGSTLSKLSELTEAQQNLTKMEARLKVVTSKLGSMKLAARDFEKLSDKLDLATAELAGVEKHLSQTSYGMVLEKFESMTAEIQEATAEYKKMEEEQESKWSLYHELKERETELTQERETRLQDIDAAVKESKLAAAEKTKAAREVSSLCVYVCCVSHIKANSIVQAESQTQTLQIELESLKAELTVAEEAVEAAEKALDEANDEESQLQMRVGEVKSLYDDAKAELDEVEKRMTQFSSELRDLTDARADLAKKIESMELEARKISVAIARIHKEQGNAERFVATMLKKHAWIESEKSAFGVEGGDYDFEATDPSEMNKQLQELKHEQESLVSTCIGFML